MRILTEENGHRLENLPASSSLQLEIDRMGIEWQSGWQKAVTQTRYSLFNGHFHLVGRVP